MRHGEADRPRSPLTTRASRDRARSLQLPEGIKAGTAIQVLVPPRCIQRPGTGLAPAAVPNEPHIPI